MKTFWFLGVFLLFQVILSSCTNENKKPQILCDAESVTGENFVNGKEVFEYANTQNSEEKYSGKFSIKLDSNAPFGMTWHDAKAKAGDHYSITVKRKCSEGEGFLVVSDETKKSIYIQEKYSVKKLENGWELLHIETFVPPDFGKDNIVTVYLWNPSESPAWFDDLEIVKTSDYKSPNYTEIKNLNLLLPKKSIKKLKEYRLQAFEKKLITENEEKWVKGQLVYEQDTLKIKLRLKGDWLDHLRGHKWSFRIKIDEDNSWNRMVEFSLQNPQSRDFLNEWVFHQWLEKEDVLTTRYEFVPVNLNGKSLGLYVFEEHFVKQLVEYKKRREGPIVRFSETGFWERIYQVDNSQDATLTLVPLLESSDIFPFKVKRVLADEKLKNGFLISQTLLEQYRNGTVPLDQVFDVIKMAKYYAVVDITNAFHCRVWHNQRFYFNPITSLLEPVVFDGFSEKGLKEAPPVSILANELACGEVINDKENMLIYGLFENSTFMKEYLNALQKFSSKEYINGFINSKSNDIDKINQLIQREYKHYRYDESLLENNAALIKTQIPKLKSKLDTCTSQLKLNEFVLIEPCDGQLPLKSISVKGHVYPKGETWQIRLKNFHCNQAEVLGFGGDKGMTVNAPSNSNLKTYETESDATIFETSEKHEVVYFRVDGIDSVFSSNLLPWEPYLPGMKTPRQRMSAKTIPQAFKKSGDTLILPKGTYSFNDDVFIPEGLPLTIEAGTRVNLNNNAALICLSPVRIAGSKSDSVHIVSEDGTGGGLIVLNDGERSKVTYTVFENLNAFSRDGWLLMGAVNFYGSAVEISNTNFKNNHCEDALNCISSTFDVRNCKFSGTYGDAFDSDFCSGKVNDCEFINIGNDAIDFSGSQVVITNCNIDKAGDKGVSGGEESSLEIKNTKITNTIIGICAKDLSVLKVDNCSITDNEYGFSAYRKKPEFGGGRLILSKTDTLTNKNGIAIEPGSFIMIAGKEIKGHPKIKIPK